MSSVHILAIAGTFMGGVAALARELGHTVSGSDQAIYPPMSTQLEQLGIALDQGYRADSVPAGTDDVVIGNALSRGNAAVEAVLDAGQRYISGAQWLSEQVLPGRDTLAVAGTHGKTTTTTILTWLLESAGRSPGFLIGGVAEDFGVSARLGQGREFVVEADEYDTAFFDKRSKFVHYRPLVAILNNLEYDHADIFPDVAAIQRQFHHLVRTVPARGRLIVNGEDPHLAEVLAMGCWTPVERFGFDPSLEWHAELLAADGSAFRVHHRGQAMGDVHWSLLGRHNVLNGLAALAAAHAVGVAPADVIPALARFRSVKRRMEVIGRHDGITIYDDFAHHPTAIATTLEGLRAKVGDARIVVAMEPRSNSMRLGAHAQALAPSLALADEVVFLHRPELAWDGSRGDRRSARRSARGARYRRAAGAVAGQRAQRRPRGVHVQWGLRRRTAPLPRRAAGPMSSDTSLPLFPLHTTLVPGAAVGLRVFERRYLDLVRDSGRSGEGFGVCLILDGQEVGAPATPAAYGVQVRIEDFDVGADGVLQLRLRGTRRFHVERTRVRDNGLVVADVRWCDEDPDDELRPQHALLATVLGHIIEQAGEAYAPANPALLDQASWVGWRLAELLPLSEQQRLQLLQMDDPHQRLQQLLGWMP